jgi:hypothetical protein
MLYLSFSLVAPCSMQPRCPAMSDSPGSDYAELLKKYHDLAASVRMIRRAVEKASRAGVLPPIDRIGISPLEECEGIARAIYAAAAKHVAARSSMGK